MSGNDNGSITKINNKKWENETECRSKYDGLDEIDPELKTKLEVIAKKEGFHTYKIFIKKIVTNGANYMGRLHEVTIKEHTEVGIKELNLFVKSAIYGEGLQNIVEVTKAYNNELYFYKELSKILTKLQDETEIPQKERYNFVRCYDESDRDHVIMENLISKGFNMKSRYDIISLEFAKKSLEEIAKFHTLSFVLQKKEPLYFENIIKNMKHLVNFGQEWEKYMSNCIDITLAYLDEYSLEKFKKFIPSVSEIARVSFGSHSIMCLCHGDYRTNNIMQRKINGELEVIPIDYQFIHYGFPLNDLYYFIITATDGEFRRTHLEYLKDHYYGTMEKFMKYFGMQAKDFFPREEYEKIFKQNLIYALVTSIWAIPILLANEDEVVDIVTNDITEISFGRNDKAKMRFQEIVNDFIQWGYL